MQTTRNPFFSVVLLILLVACSDTNPETGPQREAMSDTIDNVVEDISTDAAMNSDTSGSPGFRPDDNQTDNNVTSEVHQTPELDNTAMESADNEAAPPAPGNITNPSAVFLPLATDIQEQTAFYQMNGYNAVDVLRMDIRTHTVPGECSENDNTGCTFADVLADTDGSDQLVAEIPVHFSSDDFQTSSLEPNASLRQRGATSRLAVQKSFRIKLDSKDELWRAERRLQLNKHPYDQSRIQNKLSFDLMQTLPHLPSLRTQFVNLWIDDGAGPVDHGLYTHVEAVVKEYLVNRNLDKDDNLYKANTFFFSNTDLGFLSIDESGEPTDIDSFEFRLEIKRGNDHSKLIEMLTALNDPARSFSSVLDQYFNRNNVLMWTTVNFLLGQHDVTSQNFYLYNKAGTDTFYFLPWDYDATFKPERMLEQSFDANALRNRLLFGYARFKNSKFMSQYLQEPNVHSNIVTAASELRASYLSNDAIALRIQQYVNQVRPFLMRSPDLEHIAGIRELQNFEVYDRLVEAMPGVVETNHQRMQSDFSVPMPPFLKLPLQSGEQLVLQWLPAYDVTGNAVTYDIDVASSPLFEPETIALRVQNIADQEGLVQHAISRETLGTGEWFFRVVARSVVNPEEFWTVAHNEMLFGGETLYGVRAFNLP